MNRELRCECDRIITLAARGLEEPCVSFPDFCDNCQFHAQGSSSPSAASVCKNEKLVLAIFTLYLHLDILRPYSPNWFFFTFPLRQVRWGDFRATMVAVRNRSYRLGNATPNETKHANILYRVQTVVDALRLA